MPPHSTRAPGQRALRGCALLTPHARPSRLAADPGAFESAKKMDKKKAWEAIQPLLGTDASGTCVYKGEKGAAPFKLAGGNCTATVTDGIIS